MTTTELKDVPEQTGGYNLSNLAYKAVSEMIRGRRLRGGELIVEAKLADVLGISRTPLREALQRLEGEGLVVKAANRSFMVRNVDLGEYLQSLKVRELLEGEAAFLAAGRLSKATLAMVHHEIDELLTATSYHTDAHWRSDDNVHGLYIDGCGNAVMGRMIRSLRVTTRLFEIARLADRVGQDAVEHMEIVVALEAEDGKRARKAAQAHIKSLSRFTLDNVS